jgi:hypothetical protein
MTKEFTVGHKTTKAKAQATAAEWHDPETGYHAQAIAINDGFICRVVVNN